VDARAEQFHALHIRALTARVLDAHVDDALEIEQRTDGRRGDTVLAGASLGDDPPLAHSLSEQRLPECVVDLVRAGVVEILALEIDRPTDVLGEPASAIQRRRSPRVAA